MENVLVSPENDLIDVKKEALKYGLIVSVIQLLLFFGTYAAGVDTFLSINTYFTFIPFVIVILVVGLLEIRKKKGGYLSFQQGIQFCFLVYVILAVVSAIATYLLYNVINPDLTRISFEKGMDMSRSMMEKFGANEDQIDNAMKQAEGKQEVSTSISQILVGTGLGLIWDFIKSLILAAIFKKEKPLFN